MNENCGAFTANCLGSGTSLIPSSFPPRITFAASLIRFAPVALDTNGRDRDARRLHSITSTSSFTQRNWVLNGPFTPSSFAMALEYSRIFSFATSLIVTVGIVIIASPECTPAFWTCSIIAPMTVVSPSETPSTSTSFASSRNLLIVTG